MNHHESLSDEPPRATPAELIASDLVDGRTTSADPSVGVLADRFRSVGSAIAAPAEIDPVEMELHLATALRAAPATTTRTNLTHLGSRRGSRLLAAAVVLAVATIGGVAVDRLVVNGPDTATRDRAVAPGVPPTAAKAPSAGDARTTAPGSAAGAEERDLGAFTDVASLRIRLLSESLLAPRADGAPPSASPESRVATGAEASAPTISGTGCPPVPGEVLIARASVAGRDVVVLRSLSGGDRILDQATCEPAA